LLNQQQVDSEEETIREQINLLSDNGKKSFYASVKQKVKDPDTYAVLNWFFIVGLHHFYLGKWLSGILDLAAFSIGIFLIFLNYYETGIAILLIISILELWALFRSQLIVQHWNNQLYRTELQKFK
jgi:TM2 domain-containing membrane protein YozV